MTTEDEIVEKAETNLKAIRAELQDALDDIHKILEGIPRQNIFGDFAAAFNLSMDGMRLETSQLIKLDSILNYRDYIRTMEGDIPKPGEPNDRTDE
jgi:hypothetical protein